MDTRRAIVLLLVVAMGIILTACGRGGGGSSSVTPTSTSTGNGAIVTGQVSGEGTLGNIPVFLVAKGMTPVMARVSDSPRGDIAGSYYSTVTDEAGNFAFSDVNEGIYNVVAQADSYRSAVKYDLTVTRGNTVTVSLTLTATGEISGTAVVPQGANPLGIIAFVAGTSYGAFTDSSGSFKISGIPVGTYTLSFSGQGFALQTVTAVNVKAGQTTAIGSVSLTLGNTAFGVALTGTDRLKGGLGAVFQVAIQGTAVGPFTYSWTATTGTILNPAAAATQWTAPTDHVGLVELRCLVTDATGASSTGSLNVDVLSTANLAPVVGIQGPAVIQVGSSARYLVIADDPEGDVLTFAWQPNSGAFSTPAASETAWTAPSTAGQQTVQCRVSDSKGAVSVAQINVQVVQSSNLPPTVTILGPTIVDSASPARYIALANDPESGLLKYQWSADSGVLASPTSQETFWTPPTSSGPVEIRCQVTDSGGAVTAASISVAVQTSQPDQVKWQVCLGGSGSDWGYSVCRSVEGDGFLVAGTTDSNTGDFSGMGKGARDIFVAKFTFGGERKWLKVFGGTGDEAVSQIGATADGKGYLLAGATNSSGSEDVSTGLGNYDIWVLRLDASGNREFEKTYGTSAYQHGMSIVSLQDGGMFLFGWDGGETKFLYRLASDGSILANVIGKAYQSGSGLGVLQVSRKMALNELGGPTLSVTSGDKTEIQRYGPWFDQFAYLINPANSRVDGVIRANDGGYATFGKDWNETNGFFGRVSQGMVNLGSFALGENTGGRFQDMFQATDGTFFLAGYANLAATNGGQDAWVYALNPAGSLKFQKSLGGSGTDYAFGILDSPDGGLVLVGTTFSNDGYVSGNHGAEDAWIVKLGY